MGVPALPVCPARVFLIPLLLSAFLAMPSGDRAIAASKVGTADYIANNVTATAKAKSRTLEKDAPVYRKETIRADEESAARIIFLDKTTLDVGPGASVLLNAYVIGSPDTAKKLAVKTLEGAFRFVSGSSEKSAYRIETPVSVIGVRGTVFDLYVVPDGTTGAVLQSGALEVCTRSGRCLTLDQPCQFARIDANGQIRRRARPFMLPFTNIPHAKAFPLDTACAGASSDPFSDTFTGPGGGGGGDDGGAGAGAGDGDGPGQ